MLRIVPDRDRITRKCREEDVVGGHQVVGRQHPAQVMPGIQGLAPLCLIARRELALDDAAEALQRALTGHTLLCGGPAVPFQHRIRPVPAQIVRVTETCESPKNQEPMMRLSHHVTGVKPAIGAAGWSPGW